MRKFYREPSMDINVFDVENIVTESVTGTAVADPENIAAGFTQVNVDYSSFNITSY